MNRDEGVGALQRRCCRAAVRRSLDREAEYHFQPEDSVYCFGCSTELIFRDGRWSEVDDLQFAKKESA